MMPLFAEHQIKKSYLAVVRGYTEEAACIDHALVEEPDAMTDALADKNKGAQSAVTDYVRIATVELPHAVGRYNTARYSLVRVMPQTGRRHQIRRHMKRVYHPVLGDTTYGDGKHNQLLREEYDCQRLLLHAERVIFSHPVSGAEIVIHAGLDATLTRLLDQFGWSEAL